MLDKNDDFEATNRSNQDVAVGLAVTINSLPNERFKTFSSRTSVFVADEISQILRAITHGTVKDHMKVTTERALAAMLNKTELSVLADADLNSSVVEYVRSASNDDVKVVVVEIKGEPLDNVTYNMFSSTDTELNHALNLEKLQEDLLAGKNVYCATDSKDKSDLIYEAVSKCVDKDDVLIINSDTSKYARQSEFLSNANEYIKKYKPRLIIASPSVQSGISIEVDHFDLGYAFCTATVTPTYIAQMIHRVRGLENFSISVPCPTSKYDSDLESAEFLYLQSLRHHVDQFVIDGSMNQENTSVIIGEDGSIKLNDNINLYCKLHAELQALDTNQRNNFSSYFAIQAMDKGINVIVSGDGDDPLNDADKKDLKDLTKNYKAMVEQEKNNAIVGENLMTQDEYDRLKQANYIPKEKQAEFKRYEVALATGKDNVTLKDVEFYNKKGLKHVQNYEAKLLGREHAHNEDHDDVKAGVAVVNEKRRVSFVDLSTLICMTLGLDENTFEGTYSEKEATALLCMVLTNPNLITYVKINLGIGLKNNYCPIRFAKALLNGLFGLKPERSHRESTGGRKQHYRVNQDQVAQLLEYVKNRSDKNLINNNPLDVVA